MNALWVFVGGGLGSLVRYSISLGVLKGLKVAGFPWATLAANLLACFVAAWVLNSGWTSGQAGRHALLLIGFCGGLSTFSTFSLENVALIQQGRWDWALINTLLNLAACFGLLMWMLRKT